MKVLFLGQKHNLHPWYDDFIAALDPGVEVVMYDPSKSPDEQLVGVQVVVEQGGGLSTRDLITAAARSGVELWQVIGTGLNTVDVDFIHEMGIELANTPGQYSAPALAEQALLFLLYFAKNVPDSHEAIRSGKYGKPMSEELLGKTLGFVGFGASARRLAQYGRALEMRMLAMDPTAPDEIVIQKTGVEYRGGVEALDALLEESDFVSIHVPLLKSTRKLIDRRRLELLRPGAVIVNVSRGAVIDEQALIELLALGRIRGAGLDVVEDEPCSPDHPLTNMRNALVTQHIAGVTTGTSRRRGAAAAMNVHRLMRGEAALHTIPKGALR